MSAVRENWNLAMKDFERDNDGVLWFEDGGRTRIDIGRSALIPQQWVMNIFHGATKISHTAASRKACISAIPKLMRAFA